MQYETIFILKAASSVTLNNNVLLTAVLLYKPLYSHLSQGLVIYIVSLGCDCDANALRISYWSIFFSLLALTHLWSIWSSAALRPPESFPFVFIF